MSLLHRLFAPRTPPPGTVVLTEPDPALRTLLDSSAGVTYAVRDGLVPEVWISGSPQALQSLRPKLLEWQEEKAKTDAW